MSTSATELAWHYHTMGNVSSGCAVVDVKPGDEVPLRGPFLRWSIVEIIGVPLSDSEVKENVRLVIRQRDRECGLEIWPRLSVIRWRMHESIEIGREPAFFRIEGNSEQEFRLIIECTNNK